MTPMTIGPSDKPKTINLDCSTRAKVVIRTKLSTTKQPIRPTVPIFSSMSRNLKQLNSLEPSAMFVETPVQGRMQVPLPQPANPPQNSPRPKTHAKSIEDSKIKKLPTTTSPRHSATPMALPERKINPLPSRLRMSSISSSTTPEPEPVKRSDLPIHPLLTPSRSSQYGEEYDKCPCTRGRAQRGSPPCDRCQLLLLADRFCELIDVQCQKWGIPAKH